MRIAYIILAHQYPGQLLRLVRALDHNSSDCWIHLDNKCRITDFKEVFETRNVFPVQPRLSLDWGNFNIVQAMINSLKAASTSSENYDYYHFLSGLDYPLQPSQFFLHYLQRHNGCEFVGNRALEESQQNILRITNYHFNNFLPPVKSILERLVNNILPPRKFPYPFEIRKGPQWMTLSHDAVVYLLEFSRSNPKYSAYFHYVLAPDEFYFQTILYNSPFRKSMKNQIFHFIDWSEQRKSPKTLTINDKEKLLTSSLFFARKFDAEKDPAILDVIDERIRKSCQDLKHSS